MWAGLCSLEVVLLKQCDVIAFGLQFALNSNCELETISSKEGTVELF